MANTTALEAYNAVKALEVQMEVTDAAGYHLTVPVEAVVAKLIADTTAVNEKEAMVGIHLATTDLTVFDEDSAEWVQGLFVTYKTQGMLEQNRPTKGSGVLFWTDDTRYLSTLEDGA